MFEGGGGAKVETSSLSDMKPNEGACLGGITSTFSFKPPAACLGLIADELEGVSGVGYAMEFSTVLPDPDADSRKPLDDA